MPGPQNPKGGATDDPRLAEAAALLFGDERTGPQPGAAYQTYVSLARAGSAPAAARAAVLTAQGVGCIANWPAALDFALLAASLGDKNSRRMLAALAAREEPRIVNGEASGEAIWRGVREQIDIETLLEPPQARVISEEPRIRVIAGFAPPSLCGWLVRSSQNNLREGEVNDAATGEVHTHKMRTAKAAPLNIMSKDLVTLVMQVRAERATGLALACHEPPNVISYLPGQEFQPHFDFVDPAVPHFQLELMLQGQRMATIVTYLNDDFEGAETAFPRLNWKFKGGVGDALVFFNATPDGRVDPRTLHAGLPPTRGRKWVLSQWLRNRPQPVV